MEEFLVLTRQHLTGLSPEHSSGTAGPTGLREGRAVWGALGRGSEAGEEASDTEQRRNQGHPHLPGVVASRLGTQAGL